MPTRDGGEQSAMLLRLNHTFDLFAAVQARPINPATPFSGLLTLWLSMIAAVGLAMQLACSRQQT